MSSDSFLTFDVMLRERFICTMKLPMYLADSVVNGKFLVNEDTVARYVESKLPTLKGKDFKIYF